MKTFLCYFRRPAVRMMFGWMLAFLGATAPLTPVSLRVAAPPKVFTPNGDGINDIFSLILDNPEGSLLSQKKVFDLHGAEVADLQVLGEETSATLILRWDGKNHAGEIVPGGIYVYQVQSEGKVINGTVVVAK